MRTSLTLVVLAGLLAGCGGAEPAAAPSTSPSPSPSPSPAAVLFQRAAVEAAVLDLEDAPAGWLGWTDLGFTLQDRVVTSIEVCGVDGQAAPPQVPRAYRTSLQGPGPGTFVGQSVVVLRDEELAARQQAGVEEHARTVCTARSVFEQDLADGRVREETAREAVVPLRVGEWVGVRQSSRTTVAFTGDSTPSRSAAQTAVLRRGNALVELVVSSDTGPADLGRFLTPALRKIDATL